MLGVGVAWDRRYNVSGTIHCGGCVDEWCGVLRHVLRTDDVGTIGHFSGAVSVYASSPVADVVSCGHEVHEFSALVPGTRTDWRQFSTALEASLAEAGLACSLTVHDAVLVLDQ